MAHYRVFHTNWVGQLAWKFSYQTIGSWQSLLDPNWRETPCNSFVTADKLAIQIRNLVLSLCVIRLHTDLWLKKFALVNTFCKCSICLVFLLHKKFTESRYLWLVHHFLSKIYVMEPKTKLGIASMSRWPLVSPINYSRRKTILGSNYLNNWINLAGKKQDDKERGARQLGIWTWDSSNVHWF